MANVVYFPAGDISFASSRLRVFKIADELKKLGHNVTVVDSEDDDRDTLPAGCEVVVVQKRMDMDRQMRRWVANGLKVFWDCDDWIPHPGLPNGVQVTVDTRAKLELYPQAIVVPDALDVDKVHPYKITHNDKLAHLVTFCNVENLHHLRYLGQATKELDLRLTIYTNATKAMDLTLDNSLPQEFANWQLKSVDDELIDYDLAVFPLIIDSGAPFRQWTLSKSANRPLKAWALGIPVAGTPIQSFVDVGLTYQAETLEEWVAVLERLKSKELRQEDARVGNITARHYAADKIVERWLNVFKNA